MSEYVEHPSEHIQLIQLHPVDSDLFAGTETKADTGNLDMIGLALLSIQNRDRQDIEGSLILVCKFLSTWIGILRKIDINHKFILDWSMLLDQSEYRYYHIAQISQQSTYDSEKTKSPSSWWWWAWKMVYNAGRKSNTLAFDWNSQAEKKQ